MFFLVKRVTGMNISVYQVFTLYRKHLCKSQMYTGVIVWQRNMTTTYSMMLWEILQHSQYIWTAHQEEHHTVYTLQIDSADDSYKLWQHTMYHLPNVTVRDFVPTIESGQFFSTSKKFLL